MFIGGMVVSGNILEIKLEAALINTLKDAFDDEWQPITRLITFSDGKSKVLCLCFTDLNINVIFKANMINFSFSVGNMLAL